MGKRVSMSVVLLDRHPVARRVARSELLGDGDIDFQVLAEYSSSAGIAEELTSRQPDVVLIGAGMLLPDPPEEQRHTLALIRGLSRSGLAIRVLVYSIGLLHGGRDRACFPLSVLALRAGASGYADDEFGSTDLAGAVQEVGRGRFVLSQLAQADLVDVARRVPEGFALNRADTLGLTDAERTVVEQLVRGLDNAQVARVLNMSVSTVKSHLRRVMTKWGVQRRTQVAVIAVRNGVVDSCGGAALNALAERV